ncbi:TPA: MobA/MobL family protein [Campylobacter coli]|nr:MobA/MobL family protein [Campylobacter coli]HEE9571971.1 MobA/MobL family protein [Campylobacter coli]
MAVKNLSTRVAIIGRGAKCRGGSSAVDKSAYISRTTMYSEYDGTTYYPKYTEDLVHNEVMLPVNCLPRDCTNRSSCFHTGNSVAFR